MDPGKTIKIVNASEHNLRSVGLEFPKNKLVVVTGVSGSGKSSLIYDVLYREAESRYLGSFSSFARQFMGKLKKPGVEKIEGLSPAIALDQKSVVSSPRSTVGTITGIYDSLRLLFARVGKPACGDEHFPVTRSLFSFNTPEGACPACKGLGVEDFLDPLLLIADENRTLREGALRITAPNGYIIYSQVTLEVLDQVCRSEGFHIDIPWKELTPAQKKIVLYGSDKIEIPFGKHPLESRMKWSGITAKPREMGYYKGILPVMEAILQRDRNKNILRFVRSGKCRVCGGKRLNERALSVKIGCEIISDPSDSLVGGQEAPSSSKTYNIAALSALQVDDLQRVLSEIRFTKSDLMIGDPIISHISKEVDLLKRLGLAYLTCDRESTTLSGGESQRLRLATLAGIGLSGMICIFDEPSIGLHPHDIGNLIEILKEMRDQGNTVIVVEHEEEFIHHADWLIDIGPGPGLNGGVVLFNGPPDRVYELSMNEIRRSRTLSFLSGLEEIPIPLKPRIGSGFLSVEGAAAHNLKNINVSFMLRAMNVVTGVSGAGKSTLTNHILGNWLKNKLNDANENIGEFREIKGWESIGKVISIDQSPIGRTPRSNPATYTGLFDPIRDLFARQPESVRRGYDKSRFSFNTPGGRCESCGGAGYQQVGMHFMGNVEVLCESCEGRRFDDKTLEITIPGNFQPDPDPGIMRQDSDGKLQKGIKPEKTISEIPDNTFSETNSNKTGEKNISEILEMTVSETKEFFRGAIKILRFLETLEGLGLGYLTLGQRSSTLSGGEAQRIKLATELARSQSEHTLYIMDEPTTGLHQADIEVLLKALDRLIGQGHTVILIEHHLGLISAADQIIDLGPGSGRDGGCLLFSGSPEEIVECESSFTGKALKEYRKLNYENRISKFFSGENQTDIIKQPTGNSFGIQYSKFEIRNSIKLSGVSTHNLKNISVQIPHNKITVITGVSGSGKSSLAFDTIFAEGQNRFLGSFSPYVRSRIGVREKADFEHISGLTPTFAVNQGTPANNPRSTVGTMTGIYDHYRLLYSRFGKLVPHPASPVTDFVPRPASRVTDFVPPPASRVPDFTSSSLFSFNHQHGACPVCDGLGSRIVCDPEKLISHPGKSIPGGAMEGSKTGKFYGDPFGQYTATLKAAGDRCGFDFTQTWIDLSAEAKKLALYGTGDEMYQVTWQFKRDNRTGEHQFNGPWKGLVNLVNEEYNRKHADHRGESMMVLMKSEPCPSCQGSRLRQEALGYYIHGKNIAEVSGLPVTDSTLFFTSLQEEYSFNKEYEPAAALIGEILRKLDFLSGLGLSYLTIDRISSTLSGGETRRIRLAGQLGSGLTGITYILDEPTIGLHQRDIRRLMKLIRTLQETGNTVVIVEHDVEVIREADYIIDLGPGAGKTGGMVMACGTPLEIINNPESVTGPYLSGQLNGLDPGISLIGKELRTATRRKLVPGLSIRNAFANNLKGFDLVIPSGGIIAITGLSGSGKSTLLFDVILASRENNKPAGCSSIEGFELFKNIISVHQRTGFNSSLATPATYTGILDRIRDLFASLPESKLAGTGKNTFSYLNREGRCPECEGAGQIRISMDFLSDVNMPCEKCRGRRFRPEILSFRFQGKNIGEILEMTFNEASLFFTHQENLRSQLQMLEKVGLGYLQLGQPLNSLSGGESQRLALASELIKPGKGPSLYLFEEPSTGLHFRDIEYLVELFHHLANQGNTLLVIEHDPMIIAHADHIIELGPEGGDRGGYLVTSSLHSL